MTSLIFSGRLVFFVRLIFAVYSIFLGGRVFLAVLSGPVFQSIASAGYLDDLSVVQDAIEDSRRRRYITDQFAPLFQWPVGSHDGEAQLIPSHDNLKEILAGLLGQLFDTHIVDHQKIDFEVTVHGLDVVTKVLGLGQFSDSVEDRAIEHGKADLGGLVSDRLYEMRFTNPWRTQDEQIGFVSYEVAGGQIHDLTSLDRRIEGEVKTLQTFEIPEAGLLDSSGNLPCDEKSLPDNKAGFTND